MSSRISPRQDPLRYPYRDRIPAPGERVELAPGVFWLRMPMPGRLNHINVWLLRDGNGWMLVDTGINSDAVKGWWEKVFADQLEGLPVTRVLATHMHPDHAGLAGWLVQRWGAELWMSRTDFFMSRVMSGDRPNEAPEEAIRFFMRAGLSQSQIDAYKKRFGTFGQDMTRMPVGYRRVRDGEYIDIGGREWRAAFGHGHSPEHICLYCPELKLIIGGDQMLPRITPNVSVNPSEPRANPLKDWLESCQRLRELLPGNLLVLPAHEDLYYGLHERMTALIDYHEDALERLYDLCAEPRRPVDVFPVLFKNPVNEWTWFAATNEALAHIHCALERRMLKETVDEHGVVWYRQA
ncbi:MAG: MBL fold metallo-hydrolase [Gammaproteobacteria bacterium]